MEPETAHTSTTAAFFAAQGPLSRVLPGYKPRPQQIEMALAVEAAILGERHIAVEAGTGVGKSFAYLVPALLRGLDAGRRVVVSTHTIALQEQLIDKDLPLLTRVFPRPFLAVLAKGRSNYLAPRRLEVAATQASLSRDGEVWQAELERIASWAEDSDDGTRQSLSPQVDPDIWEQVQSEHGNCLGDACEFFATTCFYHAARRRLHEADVVVVNHSLLMADLMLRQQGFRVLPDYDLLVVDEAHTLEGVAMDHLGIRLSRRMLQLAFGRLKHPQQNRGFLVSLPGGGRALDRVQFAHRAVADFFEEMIEYAGGPGQTREIRVPCDTGAGLGIVIDDLIAELTELKPRLANREIEQEMTAHIRRMNELRSELNAVLAPSDAEFVHWVESTPDKRSVELHRKPLDVAPQLESILFASTRTAVLTSATLAVRRNAGLDWFCRAVGVPEAVKVQVGSPFNYREKVVLRVPTYLNEPDNSEDYEERAALAIQRYLERSGGGAFVLFTSYEFLRRIARRIIPRLEQLEFPVFVQGESLPRSQMLELFKKSTRSVLFGTDSFWQGVDVQGEALRLVIITRLPFGVPTAPLFRARSDRIRARGGDSFKELALPEAVIKFKQGFGRLIRTEDDRGTVVVLDTRILTKPYGRTFLEVIPPVHIERD